MMKNALYRFEFNDKTLLIAAFIFAIAFALPTLAQVPALPPLPDVSGAPAALPPIPSPDKPAQKETKIKALPEASVKTASAPMNPLADLPPAAPESTDHDLKPVPTSTASASSPTSIPALPPLGDVAALPELSPMPSQNSAPPPLALTVPLLSAPSNSMPLAQPAAPLFAVTALPEVKVEQKAQVKSWQTKLAPAIEPVYTSFNYKRDILPGAIYRSEYDDLNKHLPTAVTRQDYDNLLFLSVSRNDVEAVRALLNAGANINAISTSGETPLGLARRSNADSTAQLLSARGGH